MLRKLIARILCGMGERIGPAKAEVEPWREVADLQAKLWERKVTWMRDHRELWVDLDVKERLYTTQRERWCAMVRGLTEAGLFSPSTSATDFPIKSLIAAAKNGAREKGDSTR
jgi:hypothetical protein